MSAIDFWLQEHIWNRAHGDITHHDLARLGQAIQKEVRRLEESIAVDFRDNYKAHLVFAADIKYIKSRLDEWDAAMADKQPPSTQQEDSPTEFIDSPLLRAHRKAFDNPTRENLEALEKIAYVKGFEDGQDDHAPSQASKGEAN
jgi:hypothetical protein